MVDARSYQQMSDGAGTDQQQYMMHGDQNQYEDEFGNDMMQQMPQHHLDMQQDDGGIQPQNALVSTPTLPPSINITRLIFIYNLTVDS